MDIASLIGLPAKEEAAIKETLGCFAVGAVLGLTLYGITILQTFIYFKNYPQDSQFLKTLVAVLFILDTITTILIGYSLYDDLVNNFLKPQNYLVIARPLALENGVTDIIATLTQCFFAHRLWLLGRNKILVTFITVMAVGALGPGLAITVRLFQDRSVFSLATPLIRLLSGFSNGLSVICDITIALGLCFYLQIGRSGIKTTDSLVDRLILYAINRGALTSLCQAGHMIAVVAFPTRFVFVPFAFMEGKLYCNTLLATLNIRQSLRRTAMNDVNIEIDSHFMRRSRERGNRTTETYAATTESLATIEFGIPGHKAQAQSTEIELHAI